MSKKRITLEDVKKIAKLSKLEISETEVAMYGELLSEALDSIEVLNELDTSNTPETYQVTGTSNVFQDGSSNTLTLEDTFKNVKREKRGMFVTKAVFDR